MKNQLRKNAPGKTTLFTALAVFVLMTSAGARQEPIRYPGLEGPYLGQKPPGTTPTLFAPGFVSTGIQENNFAIAPDGKECYWTVVLWGFETILWSRMENGRWTDPEVAPFSGQYLDGWPAFRPDGRRMFFHSSRPLPEKGFGKTANLNIWYMDRTDSGWSEPRPVGPPVNGEENAGCPSVTKDGTLYISKRFSDKSEKICRSALADGKYLFFQAWTESPKGWAHDRKYNLRELIQKDILIPVGYTKDNIYWIETKVVDAVRPNRPPHRSRRPENVPKKDSPIWSKAGGL